MKTYKKKKTTPVSPSEPVRRRGISLKSETDVRRYLIKLIKNHLDGEMTPDSLRASTYALNTVLSIFAKLPKERTGFFYGHPVAVLAPGGNEDDLEPDDTEDD